MGKSSLLRVLAGLPFNGEFSGRIITSDGLPLTRRVAWMAQEDLLLPWATALENIYLGARLRNEIQSTTIASAENLLQQVGLAEVAQQRPDTLSGGMRQRVALARTLFENRSLILMDEPFAAVDAVTRLQLQTLSAKLLQGRTVLFITHDPLEALRLADQVLVLSGSPATIIETINPNGPVPRRLDDPQLLALQGSLMEALAHA